MAALALGCLAAACASGSDEPPAPPGGAGAMIPNEAPSITGQVTGVTLPTVRVEERPADAAGSAKASVRLVDGTRLLRRGGSAAASGDLRVGQRVSVWFTGPVMESYPVQATASVIVIEPDGR
ncbi:MAG: YobA family protein [Gemmatimonadota bacterium]|nr:YobA family protein [Gemmatimonadota bacterium]